MWSKTEAKTKTKTKAKTRTKAGEPARGARSAPSVCVFSCCRFRLRFRFCFRVRFRFWSHYSIRAVQNGRSAQYRSNRKKYRIDRIENHQNLQTAEKSRGWLGFSWFLDQIDRVDATYFLKTNSNEHRRHRGIVVVIVAVVIVGRFWVASITGLSLFLHLPRMSNYHLQLTLQLSMFLAI